MINKPALKVLSAVTALALASMACGIGGNTPDPTAAPKPTDDVVVEDPTSTPEPVNNSSGAITSWEEAENATIQILAEGSFVDPAEGFQANAVGAGSGFLISSDGLAVTNNHVVTGSARLKVYLNGQEYRARVLGASECWDLAVIQVVGKDLPFMEPFNDKITVGTDVYAAGFPLGDPEFTLTRGIVSKENANGESNWASVDSVVQHDAKINPGNSGGPLINDAGQVIGVNYAGNSSTDQNFAIRYQDAEDVITQLSEGTDVDSIGINGQAVTNEDGSISGIWVSSVKSGSPADQAGITGGDILMSMEGVSLGRGGTMSDYCDVIRSHEPGAVLSVDVLRFASSQMLSGQINGRELEVTSDFGTTDNGNTDNGNTDNGNTGSLVTLTDDTGAISVDVPEEWTWAYSQPLDLDRNGRNDTASLMFGPTEETDYSVSWIWIWVSKRGMQTGTGAYEWVLDYVQTSDYGREVIGDPAWGSASENCDGPYSVDPFNLDGYQGKAEYYTGCGGSHLLYVNAQRYATNIDYTVNIIANLADDAEVTFLEDIINNLPNGLNYDVLP